MARDPRNDAIVIDDYRLCGPDSPAGRGGA